MEKGPKSTDSLEKLLKLKRWEEPPPGHIDRLTSRVIARLEAEQVLAKRSVWTQIRELFDFKPLLACGYSATAMALLVLGLQMNEKTPASTTAQFERPSDKDGLRMTTAAVTNQTLPAASFHLPVATGLWKGNDLNSYQVQHPSAVTPATFPSSRFRSVQPLVAPWAPDSSQPAQSATYQP